MYQLWMTQWKFKKENFWILLHKTNSIQSHFVKGESGLFKLEKGETEQKNEEPRF